MKISIPSALKSAALVIVGGLFATQASAQSIQFNVDAETAARIAQLIGGGCLPPGDFAPNNGGPIIVGPDFDDVAPAPVPTTPIPERLCGVWIENHDSGKLYHKIGADGAHKFGYTDGGGKVKTLEQRASWLNGKLLLQDGTYSVVIARDGSATLTNSEGGGIRVWNRANSAPVPAPVPSLPAPASLEIPSVANSTYHEETSEDGKPILYRYVFGAKGNYDMYKYGMSANGEWDMDKPLAHLGEKVKAGNRRYRQTNDNKTLSLAQQQTWGEGPMTVQAAGNKLILNHDGKVRVWKKQS
ncbi:hypothetical protein [Anatilimnocola floriformis]|uniref:hypothetical protein n=1 Tax=Anatilimnocola floriformis TaxID=2948575 RepID=UPI0020C3DB69|nr:hypothetical protein [Anatilimnocola floriformis]